MQMLYNFNPYIPYPGFKNFTKRQKINILSELKIKLIKNFIIDKRMNYNLKFLIKTKYLLKLGIKNTFLRNICIQSGKTRFIFKFFNLNRSSLKFYSSFGFISGFRRF